MGRPACRRQSKSTVSPGSALPSRISSRAEGIVQRSKTCTQRSVLRCTAQRPALWAPYRIPPMDFRFYSILSAAGRAELCSWDGLAALLLHRSHYGGLPGALGCSTVPHWCGHVQRTFCNFPGRICPLSAHGSRHAVKHTLTDKTCPLGAKIQVPSFWRPFCSSMGARCASAHMMRSNTKIQINSANSDLILQAHF